MRCLTIIAALAVLALLPSGKAEGEWLQKSKHDLYKEFDQEQERWGKLRLELKRLSARHVRWGREKRPGRSRVVTLKPGYPTSSPGKVEVEWFFTYVGPSTQLEPILLDWAESVRRGTNNKVRLIQSPVRSIRGRPGLENAYDDIYQLIAFAGRAIGRERTVRRELRKLVSKDPRSLRTEQDAERFIERIGVSVDRFRKAARSEPVQRRMLEATEKLEEISIRAEEVMGDANLMPRDPILLIAGKYLVQGSMAGGVRNTFRIANRLIRRELEERTR